MGVRRKFNSNPQVLQPPDDLTSDRALMSCEVLEGGMPFIISVMTRFEVQKGQQDLEQYEISYICVFLNALLLLLPVSPCEALTMAFRTNTFALLQQENPGVKPLSCCLIFLQGSMGDMMIIMAGVAAVVVTMMVGDTQGAEATVAGINSFYW
eukprot:CAMPEP_0183785790 /NCGR_PEP_ID=MMETSP0739-20130205/66683_1 /TAXON_ID=385413 /ORGANISM="Thalassiosira miniscula, Strain CCMP1093" /LENGTH=152 /DNA_ID=CAMNT_0026029807 /DNA_START=1121 /DNA_END=1576 /DNA_ORIENTATION=-